MQLPPSLLDSLKTVKGFDKIAFEETHAKGKPVVSIRLNPAKYPNLELPFKHAQKIPWSSEGYYLEQRPSFTLDPLFHAGCYYVQEASSMFLEEVLKQSVDLSLPLKVLDLCAAPGGKSTLLQSLLSPQSMLISNEVIKTRVNILAENMIKWGASNVIVTNNDPVDFASLYNYFDVILVDAPCSGSGLFRKDKDAIQEWSEENVMLCSRRQQRILSDVLPALKSGGVLIYATCSYSFQENEAIVDWLLNSFPLSSLKISLSADWHIVETSGNTGKGHGYRFYPYQVKGEGFFIAAFKKNTTLHNADFTIRKQKAEHAGEAEKAIVKKYLDNEALYNYIKVKDEIIALPNHVYNELSLLQTALFVRKAGVKLGTVIKNELIPSHDLASSNILNHDLPAVDVDEKIALAYLRRDYFEIDSLQKGWVLLKYANIPLGWVKILSNRINNYYPTSWRIHKK